MKDTLLNILTDCGFKDSGHKYDTCNILIKDEKRILYNPKDDEVEKYYKVQSIGAMDIEDIKRIRSLQ